MTVTCEPSGDLVGAEVGGATEACFGLVIEGLGVVAVGFSGEKGTNLRKNCLFLLVMVQEPSMLTK